MLFASRIKISSPNMAAVLGKKIAFRETNQKRFHLFQIKHIKRQFIFHKNINYLNIILFDITSPWLRPKQF